MDVLNAIRKILLVFLSLSFMLFPVIFANNVYKSIYLERNSGLLIDKEPLEKNSISQTFLELFNLHDK